MTGKDNSHSLRRSRSPHEFSEGVFYSKYTDKWIVRVRRKDKHYTTLAQFEKESDANEFYKNYKEI